MASVTTPFPFSYYHPTSTDADSTASGIATLLLHGAGIFLDTALEQKSTCNVPVI